MTKPREEFEKARDEYFSANWYDLQAYKKHFADWAYDYRQAEIDQKDKIIVRFKKGAQKCRHDMLCGYCHDVLSDVEKMEAGDE